MRTVGALVAAFATLALVGCGSVTGPAGSGTPDPSSASATRSVDLREELVGSGILMQDTPQAAVELCLGAVAESYPPQCGGPAIRGEFSWEQVTHETSGGVTWTNLPYWAVGRFDPDDGERGSITLTRPLSAEPPAGFTVTAPTASTFPQICDNPTADVPDVDQDVRTQGPTGTEEEQALLGLLPSLDGYVTSWVSDGGPTFNVVVNSNAEEARRSIREVFTGPLCVERRDLPSEDEVRAAQAALADRDDLRVITVMSGVSGLLEVEVVVADGATVQAIHKTVGDWLRPEQVVVHGALRPLRQT